MLYPVTGLTPWVSAPALQALCYTQVLSQSAASAEQVYAGQQNCLDSLGPGSIEVPVLRQLLQQLNHPASSAEPLPGSAVGRHSRLQQSWQRLPSLQGLSTCRAGLLNLPAISTVPGFCAD